MSLSSILLSNKLLFTVIDEKEDKYNSLDVSTSETYTFTSETTDIVLQDGSIVNDHIINKPYDIKVSGIVSNSPISLLYYKDTNDAKKFYDELKSLRDNRILVTVSTGLDVFDSMAITSIIVTRDKDKSNALFVDIGFKKFTIVEINSKDIKQDLVHDDIKSSTASSQNKGTVQGIPAASQNVSWLSSILG